jgi:hypothetical protein
MSVVVCFSTLFFAFGLGWLGANIEELNRSLFVRFFLGALLLLILFVAQTVAICAYHRARGGRLTTVWMLLAFVPLTASVFYWVHVVVPSDQEIKRSFREMDIQSNFSPEHDENKASRSHH